MVIMIEEIIMLKDYKAETYFLAVSLADRYLACCASNPSIEVPSLIMIAITSILLAAKLE